MVFLPIPRVKALHNKHLLMLIKASVADRHTELPALTQADSSTQEHPFPGMGVMALCPRNANSTINHCKSLASQVPLDTECHQGRSGGVCDYCQSFPALGLTCLQSKHPEQGFLPRRLQFLHLPSAFNHTEEKPPVQI